MSEELKNKPTLKQINAGNEKAYDAAAEEYEGREDAESFSMKNDPIFVADFVERIDEGFPGVEHNKLAMLDIGVGPGVNLKMFGDAGFETHGIDISEKMLDVAKKRSPNSHYYRGDYLGHKMPRKFHGIMAKAFIHLFPEAIARKMLTKMARELEDGGVLFLATTIHDTASEGWEDKADFQAKARRYRRRWTKEGFRKFLESTKGLKIIKEFDMEDPRGKQWMNFMLRKVPK
jgi:trans-aconitate methyltransferase